MKTQIEIQLNVPIKTRKQKEDIYMEDGVSKIDAILVYKANKRTAEIDVFLANLNQIGLVTKTVPSSNSKYMFVQVHSPNHVLEEYADFYAINLRKNRKVVYPRREIFWSLFVNALNTPHTDPNDPIARRAWLTVSKGQPTEITFTERSIVTFIIMDYIRFGSHYSDIGIRQLISKGFILDAYPLHDGPYEWPENLDEPVNDRQLLAAYWASFKMFLKEQPLDDVRNYYGYEIGMYFAYLGFYNKMLMYAAFFGLITFIAGLVFVNEYELDHINEFCKSKFTMCHYGLLHIRQYDRLVPVSSTCPYVYMTYMSSNLVTLIYAAAMVLWCTIFKEGWKRRFHVLNAQWDQPVVADFVLRPEFIANARLTRYHEYTGEPELYISFCEQFLRYGFSIIGTIGMIGLVIAKNYYIILFEIYLNMQHIPQIEIMVYCIAITLTLMIILEIVVNNRVLRFLTRIEMPRTRLDYEKSIILKSLIFLFFNSYGRLIYIAFIKGKQFYIYSILNIEKNPFSYDYCLPPSCVFEIICLLISVLVIKPIFLNIFQLFGTFLTTIFRRLKLSLSKIKAAPRWEKDYALNYLDHRYILGEMNKLIIQFGFVSFFAACCPLTPLIALIYNLISVRLDSSKLVKYYRRPVYKKQMSSISVCFEVFETMVYVAIIINALFTAYSTNLIHMYLYHSSGNKTMDSLFVNEYANIHFHCSEKMTEMFGKHLSCVVTGFYHSWEFTTLTIEHYDYLAHKAHLALAFILIGFFVSGILSYAIEDVPRDLREFIHYHEEKEKNKNI